MNLIDLRALALWWWPWRLALLLPAAFAGYLVGRHAEQQFQPVYTAEAWVYVRSWAEQLDKAAARAQIPLAMPVEAPLFRMARDVQGYRLTTTSTDRHQTIAGLDAMIAHARVAVDAVDEALLPYVAYLRSKGIEEVNLIRPERIQVMEAPHIVGRTELQPWRWWHAALAAAAAFVMGLLWWLVQNEGRVVEP